MTDTPVDQMGRQLGYSSSNSFNVAVKRWSTLTPGKMRNLASRRSVPSFRPHHRKTGNQPRTQPVEIRYPSESSD